MHIYGKANWENLWERLEKEGNVGLDYVINPYLYPEITKVLAERAKPIVVDFGCGTNLMGTQLLFGYAQSIPALRNDVNLDHARFNALLYLGIEGSEELTAQSQRYFKDISNPKNIATVSSHIDEETGNLFDEASVDLCVSRNFLMHLSREDFEGHLRSVARILKKDSFYVFATLNPEYEILKAGRTLADGEAYEFAHGGHGEYGTFYHYFKTQETQERLYKSYFSVENKISCSPISEDFKTTHGRYYDKAIAMAYVYVLKNNH